MTSLAQQQLERIAEEIRNCRICRLNKVGQAVPGEGNPRARVVLLGEAPGKEEAKIGRPFIGRSGKLLRSLIQSLGLKENEVYITSPVKYLPSYGTPTGQDIEHGKKHLYKQLAILRPRVVVLLGTVAGKAMLESPIPVMQSHGSIIEKDGIKYFLTIHPAAALRFPPNKKVLAADFKKLKSLLTKEKII